MSRPSWLGTDGNLAFADSTAATAWANANPSLVYDGLLATAGGATVVWRGGVWVEIQNISEVGGISTFIPIGDSVTQGTEGESTTWPAWLSLLSSAKFDMIRNAGIGGNTSAQMLARIDSDVIAYTPRYVFMMVVNYCGTEEADFTAMVRKVRGIGATPIVLCPPPLDATRVGFALLMRKIALKTGAVFIGDWVDMLDTSTGFVAAGTTIDGTHPTRAMHKLRAERIYAAISKLEGSTNLLIQSNAQANAQAGGMLLVDSNADGWADGFSNFATLAGKQSLVTVAGKPGKTQRITLSSSTGGQFYWNLPTLVPGDKVRMYLRASLAGVSGVTFSVQMYASSGSKSVRISDSAEFDGVLTFDWTVPAGATGGKYCIFTLNATSGSCVLEVSQISAYVNQTSLI